MKFSYLRVFYFRINIHHFIYSTIYKTLQKLIINSKIPKEICEKKEFVMVIPYLGKQSILIKKRLTKLFSSTYKDAKLKIVYKSACKLRNIFSFKDNTPVHMQSLVLYKFLCGSCNATYIGKTKRHCKIRMCEHLGISYKTGKKLKYSEAHSTVVQNHIENKKHNCDFDCFKIVVYATRLIVIQSQNVTAHFIVITWIEDKCVAVFG